MDLITITGILLSFITMATSLIILLANLKTKRISLQTLQKELQEENYTDEIRRAVMQIIMDEKLNEQLQKVIRQQEEYSYHLNHLKTISIDKNNERNDTRLFKEINEIEEEYRKLFYQLYKMTASENSKQKDLINYSLESIRSRQRNLVIDIKKLITISNRNQNDQNFY